MTVFVLIYAGLSLYIFMEMKCLTSQSPLAKETAGNISTAVKRHQHGAQYIDNFPWVLLRHWFLVGNAVA
jgi:hypothetical protein